MFSLKIVKVYSGFVLRVFLQKVVIDGLMIKTGIKLMTEYPCK
ncbi:periplasmic chaperone domain protein [Escherichia coli 178850]|nr:periplasmic chaperone domain protein [Escherichia coli 178850]